MSETAPLRFAALDGALAYGRRSAYEAVLPKCVCSDTPAFSGNQKRLLQDRPRSFSMLPELDKIANIEA